MNGIETLTLFGRELIVEYDYQPRELPTHDSPGCDEEIIPTTLLVDGTDISELLEIEELSDRIVELLVRKRKEAE